MFGVCIFNLLSVAVALLYSTTMLLIAAYVVNCPAFSGRCCCNALLVPLSRIAILNVSGSAWPLSSL